MNMIHRQKKGSRDFSLAVFLTIICAAFILSLNLVGIFRWFFSAHLTTHLSPNWLILVIDVFFFLLSGLLWLTYRRLHQATEKRKELDDIISSINPDVLLVIDSKRNIKKCNTAVENMFGFRMDEVLKNKTDLLYFDRRLNREKGFGIEEKLERKGFHVGTATGKRKNGERLPLEIVTGKLRSGKGAVLLLRDITNNKRYEDTIRILNEELELRVRERTTELEESYQVLKDLDKMKDAFLSTVSHELRTPLTSIQSFSEILLSYEEDPETRKEFLEIISAESKRLSRLINDILDLSKIQAGEASWNDDLFSIAEVIEVVVKAQQQIVREKSLQLRLDLPREPPRVFADRDRIQQVITNLLNNAIKFSFDGGEIRIHVEVHEGRRKGEISDWIKVGVYDQGIGIDRNDHEEIFKKFRQVSSDNLKNKPKGTGLGLPICKDIISHYEGNLWVESEMGKGSAFIFTLPTTPNVAVRSDDELPETGKMPEQKKKTILVVDENPNARKVFRDQLQRKGYAVLEASGSDQVSLEAEKQGIDLIMLDLRMPIMGETDILEEIRNNPSLSNIPTLLISVMEDGEKKILQGAHDILKKPFRDDDLFDKIQAILGQEKRSILVVDDSSAVRETLRMHLENRGYPVYLAENGEEAIDFMGITVPDLVILDVMMPVKNGFDVLTWMRNNLHTRDIPVMILSAYPLTDEQTKLLSLGTNAYVNKSEGLSFFFERIDSILSSPLNS